LIQIKGCYFCGGKFIVASLKDDLKLKKKKEVANHTKVYMNFFGYDESSTILCEMCNVDEQLTFTT
jgi:hypothetical protein